MTEENETRLINAVESIAQELHDISCDIDEMRAEFEKLNKEGISTYEQN